jgi:hypothetical protein
MEVSGITLPELKARLAEQGASTSVASIWSFFRRHEMTHRTHGPPRLHV